jgi:hypothetical protein
MVKVLICTGEKPKGCSHGLSSPNPGIKGETMKYVKMLGLAAVAAAALMALVGSSSASASVFCTTAEGTTCPSGWAETAGTTFHAVNIGTLKLTTSFKNIECTESTIHGRMINEGGASVPAVAAFETLTFGGCNCTVNVISPGELAVEWTSGNNGTATSKGAEVTASCSTIFGNVHCIYSTGAGTALGTATGGEELQIDISENNIPRLSTSGLCAEKANWDATYKVTTPKPIYIAGHT